jgi:uncharacterized protein
MRFVDTSFWVALALRRDDRHAMAVTLSQGGTGPLTTTNHVLGETWTFLRRRDSHAVAMRFLRGVRRLSMLAVQHVDEPTEGEAWRWLERHDERPYSFVDATSFAVMRRLRVREALAFDDDFSAAGFIEVRP